MNVRVVLGVLLMHACIANADIVITSPIARAAPGARVELDLTITNDESEPLVIDLPTPLRVRFESAAATSILEFTPARSGRIEVAPHEFARVKLTGTLPAQVAGTAILAPAGLQTNQLVFQIDAAASDAAPVIEANTSTPQTAPAAAGPSALVDKPPPLAVSVYEPVYFLVGGDGGLNAKFQLSFRYRLFEEHGKLAQKVPWIDDIYLSFSQTSLWDLDDLSKPFRDSSYRPRLFYANYDLGRVWDGRIRLGIEAGAGHESNGKDGTDSRSYNMFYMRPTFTAGDPDGLRFYFAPLIHDYKADDENPGLKDYRGYVDWLFGFGSKGGLDFWTTVRKGQRSTYGSVEANISYPLSKLSRGNLTGWLMFQYFDGYGESLLDYQRKLDAQFRLGIAVAL
ncbi:MAG TPA: phospholipase A [Steroidobacteraceae bacterium]|jgi:outer membrane phospholipase A